MDLGELRSNLSTEVDPVDIGKPQIQEGDVRSRPTHPLEGPSAALRLADDLDIGDLRQEVSKTSSDHLVIVDQEDSNGFAGHRI